MNAARAAEPAPIPAMPPRPSRRLSTWQILKAASTNSLSICDDELFETLFVARRYLTQPVFFVSDPAAIRQVLLEKFDNYPRLAPIRRLFEIELNTGSLASEGETWWRHRRVSAPSIDQRAIAPEIPTMIGMAEALAEQLAPGPQETVIDLERWVSQMSTHLWNHVVAGGDPATIPMVNFLSKIPRKPRLTDFVPKPRWLETRLPGTARGEKTRVFEAELYDLIDRRREASYAGPRDVVWRLANGIDRKTGLQLPRSEVRDEAATLIAGGPASVRAMTWVWYLLALHPAAEARMHAEIDAVLGDGPPEPDMLPELVYTRRILDETMRLYPPIPAILRQAAARDTLCGHRIPKNSVIAVLPWIVHRHRKLWSDPDLFDPDRFEPERSAGRPRLAYIPFAAGPRVCVGAQLAITQLLVAVSVMARRYRFRLAPGRAVIPVGRVSLQPQGGLHMIVERRGGR